MTNQTTATAYQFSSSHAFMSVRRVSGRLAQRLSSRLYRYDRTSNAWSRELPIHAVENEFKRLASIGVTPGAITTAPARRADPMEVEIISAATPTKGEAIPAQHDKIVDFDLFPRSLSI